MNKLISIIVPVYNIEAYIKQCIESILSQTYTKFELILVDDGSPDNCGKICDEYANVDDRIKVFHKQNGGLSDARNYGLKKAKGEYISFIDGDDYIDINFYQMLIDAILSTDCDIAECYSINFEDGCTPKAIYENSTSVLSSFDWLTESSVGNFLPCVVWNKIYKKELFKNIEFPIGRHYEDEATTYKVIYRAKKIVRLNSALYFYRQRNGSITTLEKNMKEINEQYSALEDKYVYFKNKNEIKISKYAETKLAIYMTSVYGVRKKLSGEYKDWRKEIIRIIYDVLFEGIVPMKYKLYLIMFIVFPKLFNKE